MHFDLGGMYTLERYYYTDMKDTSRRCSICKRRFDSEIQGDSMCCGVEAKQPKSYTIVKQYTGEPR